MYNSAMASPPAELRANELLSELPLDALACVAQAAARRSYNAGETIFLQGDTCDSVYFLTEGRVVIYKLSSEGRRQVLTELAPGRAFNLTPPLLPKPISPSSAEALTEAVVWTIPREGFLRLLRTCPDLAEVVLRELARRLEQLTGLVESLSLYSVQQRLARFLLGHAETGAVTQRWTYDDLAERVGTVRDVVGRCLRSFEDQGLIRRERGQLVLRDRAGLERLAASEGRS